MRLSRVLLPAIVLSVGALAACREKPAEKAAAPAAGEMPGMPAQGEGQPGDGMKAGQEGASPPPGSVRLSADRQQFLGVVLTPVNKRSLAREVRTVGRVEYDERKLAFVNTKFAGWIERLDVDFTGVYVRKGQTLMSIYSPDLVSAQEEYLLALKAVRSMPEGASSSRELLDASRRRLLSWDIRESHIQDLERSQYEYMQRAKEKLKIMVPLTLLLIVLLLYLNFRSLPQTVIVVLSIPFALIGAIWLLAFLGYNLSVAVWVGIIALAGVAAETGVVMIVYLDEAYEKRKTAGALGTRADLHAAVVEGAVQRVRPLIMTVMAITLGLLPIMWSRGAGADVMKRIAAPMIGGMVSATVLTLILIPILYEFWRARSLPPAGPASQPEAR